MPYPNPRLLIAALVLIIAAAISGLSKNPRDTYPMVTAAAALGVASFFPREFDDR